MAARSGLPMLDDEMDLSDELGKEAKSTLLGGLGQVQSPHPPAAETAQVGPTTQAAADLDSALREVTEQTLHSKEGGLFFGEGQGAASQAGRDAASARADAARGATLNAQDLAVAQSENPENYVPGALGRNMRGGYTGGDSVMGGLMRYQEPPMTADRRATMIAEGRAALAALGPGRLEAYDEQSRARADAALAAAPPNPLAGSGIPLGDASINPWLRAHTKSPGQIQRGERFSERAVTGLQTLALGAPVVEERRAAAQAAAPAPAAPAPAATPGGLPDFARPGSPTAGLYQTDEERRLGFNREVLGESSPGALRAGPQGDVKGLPRSAASAASAPAESPKLGSLGDRRLAELESLGGSREGLDTPEKVTAAWRLKMKELNDAGLSTVEVQNAMDSRISKAELQEAQLAAKEGRAPRDLTAVGREGIFQEAKREALNQHAEDKYSKYSWYGKPPAEGETISRRQKEWRLYSELKTNPRLDESQVVEKGGTINYAKAEEALVKDRADLAETKRVQDEEKAKADLAGTRERTLGARLANDPELVKLQKAQYAAQVARLEADNDPVKRGRELEFMRLRNEQLELGNEESRDGGGLTPAARTSIKRTSAIAASELAALRGGNDAARDKYPEVATGDWGKQLTDAERVFMGIHNDPEAKADYLRSQDPRITPLMRDYVMFREAQEEGSVLLDREAKKAKAKGL